jgi:S-adenosylmethionine hydrolase
MTHPIVTLLTDFGTADAYVAAMKAVLLRECDAAHLVDVTHHVPRHDVQCGSILLERAVAQFQPRTVHLAVVDPGVGTPRRMLAVESAGQMIVCPDNGLMTWTYRRHGGRAWALMGSSDRASPVFHGRDLFAPAAGKLAAGRSLRTLARPIDDPVLLDLQLLPAGAKRGTVIHVDHFGNATTNVPFDPAVSPGIRNVRTGRKSLGPLKATYHDVAAGQPLALVGSSGLIEIAVREGSAAQMFKLHVGDSVHLQ